jgi:hypothetical protein
LRIEKPRFLSKKYNLSIVLPPAICLAARYRADDPIKNKIRLSFGEENK